MAGLVRVGIVSDTHSHWDEEVEAFFADCAELWHAGDIGSLEVLDRMRAFRPVRAVWGNIDDAAMRREVPQEQDFTLAGLRVYMRHIGGYPGRYAPGVRRRLLELRPDLFIAGHSHILKVLHDELLGLLHINPGAYGREGFHTLRTAVRLELAGGKPVGLELLRLPRHGK
ncbi:MAG: YfcE family phosphodiesterase [Bacteroidia bacterium]|nr:MAG: YfcE family phosphodiesterase [Bacteroidia bacterium]